MTNAAELETEEKTAEFAQIVAVECLGITTRVGFQMIPDGFAPEYREFDPGVPLDVRKPYADFLVAQDPHKFVIRAAQKPEAEKTKAPEPKTGPKMRAKKK